MVQKPEYDPTLQSPSERRSLLSQGVLRLRRLFVQVANITTLRTDTITERTLDAGVTVDSVLLKDGVVTVGDVAFDDATSDPLPVDSTSTADGTENSVARKDHRHFATAATSSVQGIAELATAAETTTGTDTARVIPVVALPVQVQDNKYTFVADTASDDDYLIAPSPAIAAYATGQMFHFTAQTVNTGAATLNVNSKGAKAILKEHDVALSNGDIEAGQIVTVIYDGTQFQMQSLLGNAPSGGTPTLIEDADQNTKVQTEESADEDVIRFDVAGTEVGTFENLTSSQFQVFGGLKVDDATNYYGIGLMGVAPLAFTGVRLNPSITGWTAAAFFGVDVSPTITMGSGNSKAVIGVKGASNFKPVASTTAHKSIGLQFTASNQNGGSGCTYAELKGAEVSVALILITADVTEGWGFQAKSPSFVVHTGTVSTYYGLEIGAIDASTVDDYYGIKIGDVTNVAQHRWGIHIGDPTGGAGAGDKSYGLQIQEFNASASGTQWPIHYGDDGGSVLWGIHSDGTMQVSTFAVAGLPAAATAGLVAFATDGRKTGEGAAAGTGVLVYDDGTAWRRVDDGTTVVA